MPQTLPIIPITLPTPWPSVGPVHVYLIRQDPVTLIDAGVHTPEAREALVDGLRKAGTAVSDIRRLLITHAHLDHYGQAGWIQEQSGCEVFLHPDEAGKMECPDWWTQGRDAALVEAGVDLATRQYIEQVLQAGRKLVLPPGSWSPIRDGDRFAFEHGELEAVHLPGHALGHTGFWDAESRTLIGGDHLLDGVTPNPIMEPVLPGHPAAAPHAPERALTLGQFLAALERVARLPARTVLPGHGPAIADHVRLAQRYRERHEQWLAMLRKRIQEGTTVAALTRELFPRVTQFDVFLALSEVLAHLDLLVARGEATAEWQEGVRIYRTAECPAGRAADALNTEPANL